MIKRILCIGVAAFCLLLGGCAESSTVTEGTQVTPPFWSVNDESTGATLYLLGTMHAVQPDIVYPDHIMEAYRSCDTVALELDLDDMEDAAKAAPLLLYGDGMTAEQCLGDKYAPTVEFMKSKGLYESYLDSYIPYYWTSVFSVKLTEECGLSTDNGTDAYFLSLAKKDGKEIVELESFCFQYGMMADIPMELQLMALSECVGEENYQLQLDSTAELYRSWSTFDEAALSELELFEEIPDGLEAQCDEMLELMYNSRQRDMAQKAIDYLQNGKDLFLFVGAAHFYIGEDIITLLTDAGYTPVAVRAEAQQAA